MLERQVRGAEIAYPRSYGEGSHTVQIIDIRVGDLVLIQGVWESNTIAQVLEVSENFALCDVPQATTSGGPCQISRNRIKGVFDQGDICTLIECELSRLRATIEECESWGLSVKVSGDGQSIEISDKLSTALIYSNQVIDLVRQLKMCDPIDWSDSESENVEAPFSRVWGAIMAAL